ncbi:MAG: 3-deoxy-7-phosphoheptulonate synthase [Planctomycetota bacterium]|jgi:3-deoxy-7-phosphoheptulonate synthase|nr:3-deoxy-7-phosphoheptulonate synthase [Planctomycetota bacterium]
MLHSTDDLRIEGLGPLIPPAILMEEIPCSEAASTTVFEGRAMAERCVRGEDDRLLVVVGPCSIHDVDAAKEYANRLKAQAERFSDDLAIMMRVYFEKPRTTVGWKGLINDPDLNDSFHINKGLRKARTLLVDLAEMGISSGCEFLDTISPQFMADVVSWGAIGARTTESQIHRELASGLSMPVGFKNGTRGSVQLALDAIEAARNPHHFLSVTKQGLAAIVNTKGNDTCHLILRGGSDGPNYHLESVEEASAQLETKGLCHRVMVDCSHGNSKKDPARQPLVAHDVGEQIANGSQLIFGVMIESHLVAGRQDCVDPNELTYGQSITDGCLGWDDTVTVFEDLARSIQKRRG